MKTESYGGKPPGAPKNTSIVTERSSVGEELVFAQQIISGLATGSLYALTAVAVVVVFRNTRTINLAQGDFAMIGAFLALVLIKDMKMNYYLALAAVVVACIMIGILTERLVMRPVADSDWLTLFTVTLGVYYILHGVAGWVWGRDTKAFPVTFDPTPLKFFGTIVSQGHLINMGWALVIGMILYAFFRYTKQGIAMRAVTDDPDTALLMGIPVRFIVMLTWGMAGFLAAFAGVLLAPIVYVAPGMMDEVLIKGYVAAVFGGLYSIPGAILGALMIGVAENLAGGYLGAHFKTATAFAMIVLLLTFRPQGLIGIQKRREI
ncbi:MAG: branched-chain amino acid ABC transporter permease [Deltaproteobacteria bacterium]|nr:branched-chain amino acid ABC transporter permease [Acidimicrobiia bacterium]MBM4297066.1 branched-chain amino acid ABC transporter permease [Deltaproteobacteria bacterium]